MTVVTVNLSPIITKSNDEQLMLPVNSNFFFEINKYNYWFIYLYQAICLIMNVLWSVGHDTVIVGFIVRTYQQLDLLSIRIKNIPEMVERHLKENPTESKLKAEKIFFSEIIQQHQLIFE